MKRIITIAIVLLTICLLVGGICSCTIAIDKNTTYYKGIKIRHSENFTAEDVEFVASLHSTENKGATPYDIPIPYTLGSIINNIKENGETTLYLLEMDTDKPYFICKYGNDMGEVPDLPDKCNVSDFIWVKYDNSDDILSEFEGLELQKSYILFDCVIKTDMVNNIVYNKPSKYYLTYINENSYFDNIDKLLIYRNTNLTETDERLFLTSSYFSDDYGVYTDNGINYLLFTYQIYCETDGSYINKSIDFFGEYYDVLSPDAVRFEAFDESFIDGYVNEMYGIDVEKIISLINN